MFRSYFVIQNSNGKRADKPCRLTCSTTPRATPLLGPPHLEKTRPSTELAMPTPQHQQQPQTEGKLALSIQAIQTRQVSSYRRAARSYNVPKTTLQRRFQHTPTIQQYKTSSRSEPHPRSEPLFFPFYTKTSTYSKPQYAPNMLYFVNLIRLINNLKCVIRLQPQSCVQTIFLIINWLLKQIFFGIFWVTDDVVAFFNWKVIKIKWHC